LPSSSPALLPVSAQTWNERTILEFSEAVMVPGATLEPGRYLFRLADMRSNRHTVQVLAEIRSAHQASGHHGRHRRALQGDRPGSPPAMASCFYPGSSTAINPSCAPMTASR
jgi:hypothetical protein